MGTMTVFAREAIISDKLVVVAYALNDESAIVEPPEADQDNPVTITIGNQACPCMYGGWTFEHDSMQFIVLIRT